MKTISLILIGLVVLSSLSSTVYAAKTNTTSNTGTTYRAVIVGVSDYPGTNKDLTTPVKNALAIQSCLERGSNRYLIKRLTDSDATVKNVVSKLDWLKNNADENDVSVFYYCGHGTQRDTINYEQEGDSSDECFSLYDGILRDDEFVDKLLSIKGIVFVILDCCKSAGFQDDLSYRYEQDMMKLWKKSKVFLISAFDENQLHYENLLLGYGILSFHIIGSLSTDPNGDGKITIDEVYMLAQENFEKAKNVFDIGYQGGLNIYPPRGTCYYYDFMDTAIVKDFKNKSPEVLEFVVPEKSRKNCEIKLKLREPDKGKMRVFVYWGDGEGEWFNGPYHDYEEVTFSHVYQTYKKYKISVVVGDEYGSVSTWKTKETSIENKNKGSFFLNNHHVFAGKNGVSRVVTRGVILNKIITSNVSNKVTDGNDYSQLKIM
ncbi:MAG TPA: caspase family protein [Thermoplasmatales archaeon]|nr:caspase family protein [Thermoplasmatales archaeon]